MGDEGAEPVCRMRIRKDDAGASGKYRTRTYHSCLTASKQRFGAGPEQFIPEDGGV